MQHDRNKKKMLMLPTDDINNLNKIIDYANALEIVNGQFNKSDIADNNYVKTRSFKNRHQICIRCGSKNHKSNNMNCPAKNKRCIKCNFVGHFYEYCKTKKNYFQNYTNNYKTFTKGYST